MLLEVPTVEGKSIKKRYMALPAMGGGGAQKAILCFYEKFLKSYYTKTQMHSNKSAHLLGTWPKITTGMDREQYINVSIKL